MDIDTKLYTILTASPLPTGLGNAIYPVTAQQPPPTFYCVFQTVSNGRFTTQENATGGLRRWHYQFSVFGPTALTVRLYGNQISDFLVSYHDRPGTPGIRRIIEINQRDGPLQEQTRLFHRIVEVDIMEDLV